MDDNKRIIKAANYLLEYAITKGISYEEMMKQAKNILLINLYSDITEDELHEIKTILSNRIMSAA